MFTKVRITLTAWYLLIIMGVSLSFSAFIYRIFYVELQGRLDVIETRLELRQRGFLPPPGQTEYFVADIQEAKEKILFFLAYTNLTILVFSSFAGYFLAGKTLSPIEKSMEEQKRFIADASHELKTPLTALQTSIEVSLRDKKLNLKDSVLTLKESLNDVKNLTNLTNDLLSLTRYQQTGSSLKFEKTDLKKVTVNTVNKILPISKRKNIQIKVNATDVFAKVNREGIEKLFTILIDNAVKYTPEKGSVSVFLKKQGKHAVWQIKDSGMGISANDLPRIFERFYRTDSSRSKENVAGFGLGLSIAKEIVDLHKGSIWVKSQIGKGSKFNVKLSLV
jgi:signal transduction histidine kinase